MRHEALSRLADDGVPVHELRLLAGHSSITTTQRYMNARVTSLGESMRPARDNESNGSKMRARQCPGRVRGARRGATGTRPSVSQCLDAARPIANVANHARKFGRGDRIRTCDFPLPKRALYQAELLPVHARSGVTCARAGRESQGGGPSYPGGRGRAPCTIVRFLREAVMADTTAPITWLHDLDEALAEAGRRDMHVLLDFSAAPL
jgi:hypothetical protein